MIAKYYPKSINLSTNPEEEEGDKKIDQPSIRDRSNDKPPTKKRKLGDDTSNSVGPKS